ALFDRLERDLDNLRAALSWGRAAPERVESALRLAGALWRFWDIRGNLAEGRGWLDELLALSGPAARTLARAQGLCPAGWRAMLQGDGAAEAPIAESVALWRELGDRRGLGRALWLLGMVRRYQRRTPDASLAEESLALGRELGDRTLESWALWLLG